MSPLVSIRPKDRDAIIQSLRAGVVPRTGLQYVQVGRKNEIEALIKDLDRVMDGGAGIRFVIGEYGSGKTFLLYLMRSIALEKKLVSAHADLSPDRRLYATDGRARSLYAELMRNLSTRAKPDGGALPVVVERFVSSALAEATAQGCAPADVIQGRLAQLSEMVGGFDFANVIGAYWRGYDTGQDQLKQDAVRWLRGEFTAKTDARAALGVRSIVDDANAYDHLKLFARFVRLAGFDGFLVCLDEMVNLYKLTNSMARVNNYEQLLRMVNDSLQGIAVGLGFLLGGTPEFLTDTRRGLYSYQALQSRLAENTFTANGLVDYSGPVIRLSNLTQEDFYVLLTKLRDVYESGDGGRPLVSDDGVQQFMSYCSGRIGDAYFRTPRTTIREFMNLLAVLDQNPDKSLTDIIGAISLTEEVNPDLQPLQDDEEGQGQPASDDGELRAFKL